MADPQKLDPRILAGAGFLAALIVGHFLFDKPARGVEQAAAPIQVGGDPRADVLQLIQTNASMSLGASAAARTGALSELSLPKQ